MAGKRMLASEVESAAKAEGISKTTLKRAKLKLGISSQKEQQLWYWSLRVDEQTLSA